MFISRAQSIEQIGLLLSFYRTNSERENYVKELNDVIEIKGKQKDELLSLEKVHDQTVVKYAACKEQAERHGTSRAETSGSKSSAGKHLAEVNSA